MYLEKMSKLKRQYENLDVYGIMDYDIRYFVTTVLVYIGAGTYKSSDECSLLKLVSLIFFCGRFPAPWYTYLLTITLKLLHVLLDILTVFFCDFIRYWLFSSTDLKQGEGSQFDHMFSFVCSLRDYPANYKLILMHRFCLVIINSYFRDSPIQCLFRNDSALIWKKSVLDFFLKINFLFFWRLWF